MGQKYFPKILEAEQTRGHTEKADHTQTARRGKDPQDPPARLQVKSWPPQTSAVPLTEEQGTKIIWHWRKCKIWHKKKWSRLWGTTSFSKGNTRHQHWATMCSSSCLWHQLRNQGITASSHCFQELLQKYPQQKLRAPGTYNMLCQV